MIKFLLLVMIVGADGSERVERLDNKRYKTLFECTAAKAHHSTTPGAIVPFCARENLYQLKDANK